MAPPPDRWDRHGKAWPAGWSSCFTAWPAGWSLCFTVWPASLLRGVASGVGLSLVVAGLTGGSGYRSEKRATPWVSPWWWLASLTGGGGKSSEKRKKKILESWFYINKGDGGFTESTESTVRREKREHGVE
jgi:hypothetical protein